MNSHIVPDSAQSGKSKPAQKALKDESRILSGWMEDTEHTLEALQSWLIKLKRWQHQATVTPKEFEGAHGVILRAGLGDWAKMGINELRTVVTGEKA